MSVDRKLTPSVSQAAGRCLVDGQTYVDFSSNDYLGVSSDKSLLETVLADVTGFGATGSRLLSGDSPLYHQLESELATWLGTETALVFNTGYQMNLGVVSTLWGPGDVVFMDRAVHASMVDGVRLSGARFFRYRHQDFTQLSALLTKHRGAFKRAVILTESVFSMDGDVSDLAGLVDLKRTHDCELYVDEAHAVGVFGDRGAGCVSQSGLSESVDFILGTFGKAFGSSGGFIGCSAVVKERLVNQCRSFIYSTGLPAPVLRWNLAALLRIQEMATERQQLLEMADWFRESLKSLGADVLGGSQIVPVICGGTEFVNRVSAQLKAAGYWVPAIRKPTVPESQSRIRLSLSVAHERAVLEGFLETFQSVFKIHLASS